jgi:membrane protease YdiL (CAAX protease family)
MALLLTFITLVITIVVGIYIGLNYGLLHRTPATIVVVIAGQLISWPLTLYLGMVLIERSWSASYAINRFPFRIIPGLVATCFGFTFVLGYLAGLIPMPESFRDSFEGLQRGSPLMYFLAVVVIAPIAEELFFRGWMLRGFLANYSPAKSIWLTAVIFALFHLNPWQGAVALPLGLLFGWLVLRTGSLAPGIIGHFIVNFTTSYLLMPFALLLGHTTEEWSKATELPSDVVLAGAAIFVIGLFLLKMGLVSARRSSGDASEDS